MLKAKISLDGLFDGEVDGVGINEMQIFEYIREGLWDFVLPSFFKDADNPRIDCYQNTKENRVIMFALMDFNLRLKEIEKKLKWVMIQTMRG